ncbi:MAG: DedA family protein, partial [Mailhella sp.]|nr:DedA family protein [Mailhella sp.]
MTVIAYLGIFASAFVSATLLPAQSEAVLGALLADGSHSAVLLIAVATLGNTLGAATNWLLGLYVNRFKDRRWFPVKPERLAQAERWYRRWGRWSLLLSWAPLIGDALCLAAGVLREPLPSFLAIVFTAKLLRYLAIAGAVF